MGLSSGWNFDGQFLFFNEIIFSVFQQFNSSFSFNVDWWRIDPIFLLSVLVQTLILVIQFFRLEPANNWRIELDVKKVTGTFWLLIWVHLWEGSRVKILVLLLFYDNWNKLLEGPLNYFFLLLLLFVWCDSKYKVTSSSLPVLQWCFPNFFDPGMQSFIHGATGSPNFQNVSWRFVRTGFKAPLLYCSILSKCSLFLSFFSLFNFCIQIKPFVSWNWLIKVSLK